MEIVIREEDGVTVVALSGRIDAISSVKLEESLMGAIGAGANRVILDLKDVALVSSAGLRVILMAAQGLHGRGRLALLHPRDEVLEILELAGFDTILPIHTSYDEARDYLS